MIKIYLLFFLTAFIPITGFGQKHSIFVDGDINFDNSYLSITEAGMDYTTTNPSEGTLQLSVLYTLKPENNPNYNWRVSVHVQNLEWNESLKIKIRRTGSGRNKNNSGNPKIYDGLVYQPVSNTPIPFFKGKGEIIEIPVSVTISGYSVIMGAGESESSLIFTVYDD
ncbi:MAG TPA: hypothetical protein VFD91_06340 [Mariniphaga sp.]|nr:hypothetical protein [Mariniphaga sp.]